ncbi:hypothetical protein PLICRDRAFT_172773 [Plicaturopsis crispa FD-325 SS-3]|nr:hypothetical protein PLICRDRAFT_172773 [Plicaturopsis crispa FD-325 SS-3]
MDRLLRENSVLLLDGGLGTTLEDVFHKDISHTPLWSSKLVEEDPQAIVQAHLAFLRAGARVILTSTYQSAFNTFERAGHTQEDAVRIMRESVKLASDARAVFVEEDVAKTEDVQIALSLGPFGATLSPAQEFDGFYPPPYGPKAYSPTGDNRNTFDAESPEAVEASIQALSEFHLERLSVFARDVETWPAIDCVAFETAPLAREVKAIRRAVDQLQHTVQMKPWWISLIFPHGRYPEGQGSPGDQRLEMRDVVEAALGTDEGGVPDGIGINCTETQFLPRLIAELADAVAEKAPTAQKKPWLVVYPNGGDVYDTVTQTWGPSTTGEGRKGDAWARQVGAVVQQIQRQAVWSGLIVGGCCKTGPEEIRALGLELGL